VGCVAVLLFAAKIAFFWVYENEWSLKRPKTIGQNFGRIYL
jgi:hypothetical protein